MAKKSKLENQLEKKLKKHCEGIETFLISEYRRGQTTVRADQISHLFNLKLSIVIAILNNTPNMKKTDKPNIFEYHGNIVL
jgi:hypothetical protein